MRTTFTDPDARAAAGFYRMRGPVQHTLDPELLERLVPLRVLGYDLAVRKRDRDSDDDHRRDVYDGPTVDSELRKAGITFDGSRSLWLAYERETRRLAEIELAALADLGDEEPSNDAEDHRSAA